MDNLSDEELLQYNKMGIVPGPYENRQAFIERVHYCLNLKNFLENSSKLPLSDSKSDDPEVLQSALKATQSLYDVAPSWLPVFFNNYRLPFWHGGCAWIFQIDEQDPTGALIQLNKHFRASKRYLKIYDRDELLAHEIVHVGRMSFSEPRFEEVLAYRTASSKIRRWLGPIVQSSIESVLFVLLLGVLIVFDIFLVINGGVEAYTLALWLKLIPIGLIGLALVRLWKRHRELSLCLQSLEELTKSKETAMAIAYRLTDKEIRRFAHSSPTEIQEYANTQASKELRWQLILKAYLYTNNFKNWEFSKK